MKKFKTIQFFLALCYLSFSLQTYATRIIGAEMSYQWVSGNTFNLELSVYRDCGSALGIGNRQRIYYSSFSCRPTQDSINMVQVGQAIDISPLCKREPSTCKGGTNFGIQKFKYIGTVTLPSRCPDWVFYFRQCNRSANINNLLTPQNNCIYIEARINNLLAQTNSSAKVGNDPISYLCNGQEAEINPAIVDPNGDRLRVELVSPRNNSIIPNVVDQNIVKHLTGFSPTNPLKSQNGFKIDSGNGTMKFTPTQEIVAQVALKISEFRAGKFVGSTMVDFPILVQSCENLLPILTGFDGGPSFEKLVCLGDSLKTQILAFDSNEIDTLNLSWTNKPTRSIFKANKGRAQANISIEWKALLSDTGDKIFTVTAVDDRCPAIGSTTKTYTLKVREKPTITSVGDTFIACGAIVPISASVKTGKAPFSYSWPGRSNTTQVISVGHGVYTARITDATGCYAEDSIRLLGSSLSGSIQIDTSCFVEGVQLTAVPSSPNQNLIFSYEWTFPPENQIYTGVTIRRRFQTSGLKNVILTITSSDACRIGVLSTFNVCNPPAITARFAPNVCQGKEVPIGVGALNFLDRCATSRIEVWLKARNWVTFPINGVQILPPDSLRPDSNTFQVTTYSLNNCKNQKEFKFKVRPSPGVLVYPDVSSIQFNCFKPDTTIRVKIYKENRFQFDSIWGLITLPDTVLKIPRSREDTIYYSFKVSKPGSINVQGFIEGNCSSSYVISYLPVADAVMKISQHCKASDFVKLTPVFPKQKFVSFSTDLGNGSISLDSVMTVFYPPNKLFYAYFRVEDSLGCKDTTKYVIDTRLPDSTVVLSSDTACLGTFLKFAIKDTILVNEWKLKISGKEFIFDKKKMQDSIVLDKQGKTQFLVSIKYKQGCTRSWSLPGTYVRKPLIPKSTMQNVCAYDSNRLKGSIVFSEYPVVSWKWNYFYPPKVNLPFKADSIQNPVRFFSYNGNFRAILTIENKYGCLGKDTLDSTLVLITQPKFNVNGNCQNDSLIFFVGEALDSNENIERYTYEYSDSSLESTGNGQGLHQFREPGVYNVNLFAYSIEGCFNKQERSLEIKPRPKAVFSLPPPEICQRQKITGDGSDSKPAAVGELITSFVWATSEENPFSTDTVSEISFDEPGPVYIALQVKSTNGCQDYLKIPFDVKPGPVPDFSANEEERERVDKIFFEDKSEGATSWKWDFGDGNFFFTGDSSLSSPSHFYSFGEIFKVKQLVVNDFGCADSITKDVNLKAFLALPNAFSPNGDGRNDECRFLYRFIEQLHEFRIYNRLGQLVFDGSGDVKASWNGQLHGINQPNGSYLYSARATTVFGENLELKGSITLVR